MSESDEKPFSPNWTSPPGDTIFDWLQENKITQAELAKKLHLSLREMADLLKGEKRIGYGLAGLLSKNVGSSLAFWLARDREYCKRKGILDQAKSNDKDHQLSVFDQGVEQK
jgi:plasmid maintenance system antidote protein VapI